MHIQKHIYTQAHTDRIEDSILLRRLASGQGKMGKQRGTLQGSKW